MSERVYFMRGLNSGLTKIGYSCNLSRRRGAVRCEVKEPVELLGSYPGGRQLEAAYHIVFEDRRVHGEWFRDLPAFDSRDMDPATIQAKGDAMREAMVQEFVDGCAAVKEAEEVVHQYLRRFPAGPKRRVAIAMALEHGWTKAKVARALGLSPARIGQILSEGQTAMEGME